MKPGIHRSSFYTPRALRYYYYRKIRVKLRYMNSSVILAQQTWPASQCLEHVDQIVWYRYINFYYFDMKMSFWPFVMCQVDTSESLEDIFPGGLINRGKNLW